MKNLFEKLKINRMLRNLDIHFVFHEEQSEGLKNAQMNSLQGRNQTCFVQS
jgi:hypothetical protein